MIAKFAFWKPKNLARPSAVLVIVPPSQSDGRYEVKDREWQEFATDYGIALVGCYFQDAQPGWIEDYANVRDSASGFRLIEFLRANFEEGIVPPIFLWGFSAGGQFAYEFTVNFPNMVAGFVVNKGGVYWTALAPEPARRVPGLWIVGMKDSPSRIHMLLGIFMLNQRAGARWVKLEEEHMAHQEGCSREAGREFFTPLIERIKREAEDERVRQLMARD